MISIVHNNANIVKLLLLNKISWRNKKVSKKDITHPGIFIWTLLIDFDIIFALLSWFKLVYGPFDQSNMHHTFDFQKIQSSEIYGIT